jgi:protein-disulfide isomerase
MSKRHEIRARRQRQRLVNRLLVIGAVVLGVGLIAMAVILPGIQKAQAANALATNAAQTPVVQVTPRVITAQVNGTSLGDPNAPVKVDVYEDFRCSACMYYTQKYEPTVIQNYVDTGKVYYTYHSFIVIDGGDGTDASYRSANAAMCASEQGLFWEYHDTLFANQVTESATLYTDARLITMAENIGLDMTKFNQCYQAKKYASTVKNDISEGQTLGVNGTPSIFVNGTLVSSFDQTATAIDNALSGK